MSEGIEIDWKAPSVSAGSRLRRVVEPFSQAQKRKLNITQSNLVLLNKAFFKPKFI